jgi:hypothetical protein
MSTEEVTFDAPAKKKVAKKKAKPRAAAKAKPEVSYPGMTRSICADACFSTGKCSISGSYCAHPTKGGLHAKDMSNPAALKRLQLAREQLQIKIDPDRFK